MEEHIADIDNVDLGDQPAGTPANEPHVDAGSVPVDLKAHDVDDDEETAASAVVGTPDRDWSIPDGVDIPASIEEGKSKLLAKATKTLWIAELDMPVKISKLKFKQYQRVQEQSDGNQQVMFALCIAEALVEPELTEQEVEDIDLDILIDLGLEILYHSKLKVRPNTSGGGPQEAARKSDAGT